MIKNGLLFMLVALFILPGARGQTANLEPALDAFVQFLDGTQERIRAELAGVANSPEARAGDWSAIEPLLLEAGKRAGAPGAWFYIQPDGSYYRVGDGLTGISLVDRPYFSGLFAGEPVSGFPLTGRSTGQKSAFFAVPVTGDDGSTSGAVGMSLFLEVWQAGIGKALKLPAQLTWFVMNTNGLTLLDRDAAFIFMSVLEDGGPTLREAAQRAYASGSGPISYEIGGKPRVGLFRKLPGIDWWLVMAEVEAGSYTEILNQLGLRLERARHNVQAVLTHIDQHIIEALEPWQNKTASMEEIQPALMSMADGNTHIREASLVDPGPGVQLPALLHAARTADGAFSAELMHPLYNDEGDIYAVVRSVIVPGDIIEQAAREFLGPGYEIWAIEQDGTHIYDANEEEIGRNLLTDPLYAGMGSLLDLGERMQREPEGTGDYVFMSAFSGQKAVKVARWMTVTLHDRAWRLVMVYRPYHD
ncbi:MAG: cache domain-containing protein [Kiritimatiellia bacterium]